MSPQPDLPSAHDRSPMLPRNVTTSRPELEQRLLATLDALDEPISITTAIRDRDGRIFRDVVETGRPFHRDRAMIADSVTGGTWIGGIYDLRAIRLGDGYLSTWRLRAATHQPG